MATIKDLAAAGAKKGAQAAKMGAKKGAQKGAKAAGKAADNKLSEKSDTYRVGSEAVKVINKGKKYIKGVTKALKNIRNVKMALQAVGAAAKGFIAFIVSGPIGWITGGVIVLGGLFLLSGMDDTTTSQSGATSAEVSTLSINGDGVTTDKLSGLSKEQQAALLADCGPVGEDDSSSSDDGSISSDAAAGSDWTKKGSVAYKTAKRVFDSWVDKGLSAEAAAGIVGWVNSEGGFDMIGRAEGHYGPSLEENSIKFGNVPLVFLPTYPVGKTGKQEGGGGIYQFTPYSKYADLKDSAWEDADKMNEFVGKAIAAGDWVPSMDLSGENHSFIEFAKETDISSAALAWQAYERGSVAHIRKDQKISDAKKALEMFGDGQKFNATKFKKHFGNGTAKNGGGTSSSSSSSDSEEVDGCSTDEKKRRGGTGWSADGTGSVNYRQFSTWKPDDLPDDLKEYAVDPESVGMGFGSSKGWPWPGNQCTNLTNALMYNLWEKDGKHPDQRMGNGADVVGNWVSTFGGKASKTPTSAAAFSGGGVPPYGHTGVVSHVFENDDILIVEQNFTGYSGAGNGTTTTWNYRYVPKSQYQSEGWTFYDPSQVGYELVSDASAMG